MTPFDKVLVANRGEIACRVMRTCHELGLSTVAVYSDADAKSPHVRLADEAVRLGPAPVRESYLNLEAVLAAAHRTGAQAIHPGYGFLSENPDFAEAVADAGLVFIGPRAETIRAMGSKAGARALMARHGVPVVPGYSGLDQSDEALIEAVADIGFPVLIKASAGGGGKGMSIVRRVDEMPSALAQARRVAGAAFGDSTLLLERYVESPRHVEVQIFGDRHGNAMHLFERECSIQRRFQKIIEESPSPAPALTPAIRAALCEAGVTAARAMGYEGAGTVEFLLDAQGCFYFLEVNTRLQVEHPVTELVTGLDLVRLQVLVAMGAKLPELVPEVRRTGHAIEARLYAEDPAGDFLPATGRLLEWTPPEGAGIRVDAGVAQGSVVGIDYDPLLAKLVAWGPTRAEAVLRLGGALRRLGVQGVTTNRTFLRAVLAHPAFAAGDTNTHFIADHFPVEARAAVPSAAQVEFAAIAAALTDATERIDRGGVTPAVRPGFRLDDAVAQWVEYSGPSGPVRVEYQAKARGHFRARAGAVPGGLGPFRDARLEQDVDGGHSWRLSVDGHGQRVVVLPDGPTRCVRGAELQVRLVEQPRFPDLDRAARAGGCEAPMPGRVVAVLVEVGDRVAPGQPLVILEAMKMEQTLTAGVEAVVLAVRIAPGDRVEAGAVLVTVGPPPENDGLG